VCMTFDGSKGLDGPVSFEDDTCVHVCVSVCIQEHMDKVI